MLDALIVRWDWPARVDMAASRPSRVWSYLHDGVAVACGSSPSGPGSQATYSRSATPRALPEAHVPLAPMFILLDGTIVRRSHVCWETDIGADLPGCCQDMRRPNGADSLFITSRGIQLCAAIPPLRSRVCWREWGHQHADQAAPYLFLARTTGHRRQDHPHGAIPAARLRVRHRLRA